MVERRRRHWWRRENWYRDIWLAAVTLFVYLAFSAQGSEVRARRDQTCIVFERLHQADIKRLSQSYQYVDNLSVRQRREPLNVAVLRSISGLEQQVREGKPPAYCKGDVGIDDKLLLQPPKRPLGLHEATP